MSHWLFKHLLLSRQKKEGFQKAFTLVELVVTVAIVGILAALALPRYTGYMTKAQNTTAIADIRKIESQIERFRALNGRPPNTFAEASIAASNDSWGNAYQYLRIQGLPAAQWQGSCRKDKLGNPLNSDYDLYSDGADGQTSPAITAANSQDDIIRANKAGYIGLASQY